VRDRCDLEVRAVTEFFGLADRVDKLQDKVAVLEAQQGDDLVGLADEVVPSRGAATVGWPVNRVREAAAAQSDRSSASANGPGDE
jgi:hypothetical protein